MQRGGAGMGLLVGMFAVAAYFEYPGGLLHGWGDGAHYWDAVWGMKWFCALLLLGSVVGREIWARTHIALGLFVGYMLASAAWVFAFQFSYQSPAELELYKLRLGAAYTYAAILAIASVPLYFRRRDVKLTQFALEALCLVSAAVIVYQALAGVPAQYRGGLYGNPSMSGCLVAFLYPFAAFRPRKRESYDWDYDSSDIPMWAYDAIRILLPPAAVLLTGTSQPLGVLAVGVLARHVWRRKLSWRWATAGIAASAIVIFTIPAITSKHGRSPFDDSGRFEVYRLVMKPWWDHGRRWLGQGTGTAQWIVPHIQAVDEQSRHKPGEPFQVAEYHWLHSDWLQILFENGIVGATLALLSLAATLRAAWRRSAHVFGSTCAYAAAMVFNFPWHLPVHAICGALIIACAFGSDDATIALIADRR